jgi:hypothetical protein
LADKFLKIKKNIMRNIKIAILLMAILCIKISAKAQTEIQASTKTYSQIFDSLSTGLIPSRIPYGTLMDRNYADFTF